MGQLKTLLERSGSTTMLELWAVEEDMSVDIIKFVDEFMKNKLIEEVCAQPACPFGGVTLDMMHSHGHRNMLTAPHALLHAPSLRPHIQAVTEWKLALAHMSDEDRRQVLDLANGCWAPRSSTFRTGVSGSSWSRTC